MNYDCRKLKDQNFVERLERLELFLTNKFGKRDCSSPRKDELAADNVQLNSIDPLSPSAGDTNSTVPLALSVPKRTHRSEYLLGGIKLFDKLSFSPPEGENAITVNDKEHHGVSGSHLSQIHQRATSSSIVLQKAAPWKAAKLPARETTRTLLNLYYESPFSTVFPIADAVLFPIIVEKAYKEENLESTDNLSAKACIYSFMAFTSIASDAGETRLPPADVEGYVVAAQLAMADFLNVRASTEVIDALMMLVSCSIYFPFQMKNNVLRTLYGSRNFWAVL